MRAGRRGKPHAGDSKGAGMNPRWERHYTQGPLELLTHRAHFRQLSGLLASLTPKRQELNLTPTLLGS